MRPPHRTTIALRVSPRGCVCRGMPLHDHTTVGNKDNLLSVKNADAPDRLHSSVPGRQGMLANKLKRLGVGAELTGPPGRNWRTKIKWSPVDADTEDGTGVEAKVLGPDHPMGDTPDSANTAVCPRKHKLEETTGDKTYIKGHLLNEHLGGPGNDSRNLTAIPYSTNNPAMSGKIEEPLKKLVNEQHAWVYYKLTVAHDGAGGTRHATQIAAEWHQLQPDGAGDPEMVPGTQASCVLDIPTPEAYAKRGKLAMDYSTATTSPDGGFKKKMGAVYNNPVPTLASAATAKAKLAWNTIVLRDWKYVTSLQQSLAVTAPIIAELTQKTGQDSAEQIGTGMVGALSSPIATEETDAMKWLADELAALEKDSYRRPDPAIGEQLDKYATERDKRLIATKSQFKSFLEAELPLTAAAHLAKINTFLDTDPLATTRGLLKQLTDRAEQEEIDRASEHLYRGPMTPFSLAEFSHDELPAETDTSAPDQLDRKRRRMDDASKPKEHTRLRQSIIEQMPTGSATTARDAVTGLKDAALLDALTPLKPLDEQLHQMITLLGSNTISADAFDSFLRGHRDKHADAYHAYIEAMLELPEVKTL